MYFIIWTKKNGVFFYSLKIAEFRQNNENHLKVEDMKIHIYSQKISLRPIVTS